MKSIQTEWQKALCCLTDVPHVTWQKFKVWMKLSRNYCVCVCVFLLFLLLCPSQTPMKITPAPCVSSPSSPWRRSRPTPTPPPPPTARTRWCSTGRWGCSARCDIGKTPFTESWSGHTLSATEERKKTRQGFVCSSLARPESLNTSRRPSPNWKDLCLNVLLCW